MLSVPGEMIYKFQNDFIKCNSAYSTYENIERALMSSFSKTASIPELGRIAASMFDSFKSAENKVEEHRDLNGQQSPFGDELAFEAGLYVIRSGKASIGYLQRVFKIGFNRAARIMDILAENGLVGPELGTRPREILMTENEWESCCGCSGKDVGMPNKVGFERIKINHEHSISGASPKNESDSEPEIKLRPFAEFDVQGTKLSIRDHKINYSKPMMTRLGEGTLNASFAGCNVKRIIYRKPTYFRKGFFTFEFNPDTGIKNANPGLLYADQNNVSEVIKVEFGFAEDATIKLFLQQISEDIGLPISNV